MKNNKTVILERLKFDIVGCSYDTVFFRMNVYSAGRGKIFDNILKKPIYIVMPKEKVTQTMIIDLSKYMIEVEGDFLITLEQVKDLGPGQLLFYTAPLHKSFSRRTSQGTWKSVPVGISLSVDVLVRNEK